MGHVYQGRFKSFPIASDEHLLTVLRYVERNPLRAELVRDAEAWRWCSLSRRLSGSAEEQALLSHPPVALGKHWRDHVNQPQTDAEEAAIRMSIARGQPYSGAAWMELAARRLGLESSLRPRGRPRKK